VDPKKRFTESVFEIRKSHAGFTDLERRIEADGAVWFDGILREVGDYSDESAVRGAEAELTAAAESLRGMTGSPRVNELEGRILSLLVKIERRGKTSRTIMERLLGQDVAKVADAGGKRLLVVNPATSSTKVAYFEGVEKRFESELHLSPDDPDDPDFRAGSVSAWLERRGIALSDLDGIACRCGFLRPVPPGTYRLAPQMLDDLASPRIEHASNQAVAMAMKLAEAGGKKDRLLLTTSDPIVSDELETVERLTGHIRIRRDGTGAHYLNHIAVLRMLASLLGRPAEAVDAITVYLGKGFSIVLHRGGEAINAIDAFSGIVSTERSGPLDIPRLLDAIRNDNLTIKDLAFAAFSKGGLLSLSGTNDFRTLEGFRNKGASPAQRKKIELLYDFFARKISAGILGLTVDGKPVEYVAISGGIAGNDELFRRVEANMAGRYPIVRIPVSFEQESLAAGLIRGFYEPESLKDYVDERDALSARRAEEDRLIDTVVFERKVIYRKKGAQIVSLDDLIDDTRITVKENFTPTIAIVGAENEEAILAAKRANEEGNFRIARFKLLGDFAEINKIAYDFDLVIDNDNYSIVDTENPVEEAVGLLDRNEAQILMKGFMKTEDILRGVFQYLKRSGRLRPGELISHVFVMDIPVRNKLLLISDAAVNTYPDEEKRIKIVENTLTVAANLNIRKPKVAIISAIENVNKSIESSIVAERIARRFDGREDCIVEGPLSFDVAMDPAIAREKHYKGLIQGTADILVMPDIDAGNVLYKSLTTQSGATCAGVILAGNLPLVLTSRGDSARSKLASISLAVKLFFNLTKRG
jgi:butyrate kinase